MKNAINDRHVCSSPQRVAGATKALVFSSANPPECGQLLCERFNDPDSGAQSSMKSSLMKLNHVSTFSGKGHMGIRTAETFKHPVFPIQPRTTNWFHKFFVTISQISHLPYDAVLF